MEIYYLLLNETVGFEEGKNLEEQKNRIYEFVDVCEDISQYEEEIILYSTDIFNQSINGLSFADWLYKEEEIFEDEKRLLQIMFHKDFKNDDEDYASIKVKLQDKYYVEHNLASISIFNKVKDSALELDSIFLREDCFKVRRLFLHRTRDRIEFIKTISKAFPNLYLGEGVESSIRHFNPIGDHVDEIIKHLSALNDHAVELFETYSKEGETKVLDMLSSKASIICSPEGNFKVVDKYLTFNFKDTYGKIYPIKCSPHTKLYRADTDYRIYFTRNNGKLKQLPQILIGHIGGHPYG